MAFGDVLSLGRDLFAGNFGSTIGNSCDSACGGVTLTLSTDGFLVLSDPIRVMLSCEYNNIYVHAVR